MRRAALMPFLAILLTPSATAAEEQGGFLRCLRGNGGLHPIDLRHPSANPERFKGPGTIELRNLNRMRFATRVGVDVTFSPGPDLSVAGFIPVLGGAGEKAEDAASKAEAKAKAVLQSQDDFLMLRGEDRSRRNVGVKGEDERVADEMKRIQKLLSTAASNVKTIATQSKGAALAQDAALKATSDLALQSDQILAGPGGASGLAARITKLQGTVVAALAKSWASDTDLTAARVAIDEIIQPLEDLPLRFPGFSPWAQQGNNRDDYRRALEAARAVSQALKTFEAGSDQRKAFDTQRGKLREWESILIELTPNGVRPDTVFSETHTVACGYPFFENKQVKIELVLVDRLEADPKKAEAKRVVALVDCPSNVSVTGGVGVSGVDETDIQLVSVPNADGTEVVRKIRFEDRGSTQVNPITLIQTRLTSGEACDWHIAAGTVFDVDHPDSGVKLGYVLGASFSFKDNFFLTGGLQFSRTARVAEGVDVSIPVPSGLDKAPIEREWDYDWVFVGSFKIN